MKTMTIQELVEHISEILHTITEGETTEIIDNGEVIAHLVPAHIASSQYSKRDSAELSDRAWTNLERLSTEIGKRWQNDISAVDAIREVRRDL